MLVVQKYVANLLSAAFGEEQDIEMIHLQVPPKKEHGDLCFALFEFMKQYKLPPHELGNKVLSQFSSSGDTSLIDSLTLTGPYINIKLQKTYYNQVFKTYFKEKKYYLRSKSKKEVIIVDYIGANVGKPLHIGHMCTPLQGQVCINLMRKLGHKVIGDSHIGDWGIIFGKLIVAYERYGSETKLQADAVDHLFDLYVRISSDSEKEEDLEVQFREAFKKLSEGDSRYVELWKKFTTSSIDTMNILLSRIFVIPDYNIGESFYEGLNLPKLEDYPDLKYNMKDIVIELIEKGIASKNEDNSVGVVFPEESKLSSCILQKRDGTHGYLASDLACIKYRAINWNPSRILYFVDVRQQLHFKQAFEIAKKAGWVNDETLLHHAFNGFISLKDGAMSTRKGRIIKLGVLFDEALERAKSIIREKRNDISEEEMNILAEKVGIGAIKYGYLKKSRELDSVFDWGEFMTFDGNSGPYIQYAYVRAKKILSQSNIDINTIMDIKDFIFSEDIEVQLIQKLLAFPDTIADIEIHYNFHQLCLYTYELTKLFSTFYAELSILNEQNDIILYSRLSILQCFTEIIEESFSILGIELPLEM
ncbi:arginine--tRNA ligase [Candidatus Gracilibacteria bacterium]|nr:arginine--tRNA ligase [Candidatus Gracilibacteria bacterium]